MAILRVSSSESILNFLGFLNSDLINCALGETSISLLINENGNTKGNSVCKKDRYSTNSKCQYILCSNTVRMPGSLSVLE